MTDKPLTKNITLGETTDLTAYEANGGYEAVRKTVGKLSAADVLDMVKESNLRGRGGAGFPTGMKWSFVPMGQSKGHKYLVCNADEMEPGAFKDRLILEHDPHQLIEGMILSAYTIDADIGYIFIRAEYHTAAKRLRDAIMEAKLKGYLGENILGTGYSFELYLHISAVKKQPC